MLSAAEYTVGYIVTCTPVTLAKQRCLSVCLSAQKTEKLLIRNQCDLVGMCIVVKSRSE